jgi:hypothetical protein
MSERAKCERIEWLTHLYGVSQRISADMLEWLSEAGRAWGRVGGVRTSPPDAADAALAAVAAAAAVATGPRVRSCDEPRAETEKHT